MPYVSCATCGLTTFCVRSRLGRELCPGCGRTLAAAGSATHRVTARAFGPADASDPLDEHGEEVDAIEQVLALAHAEMGMDLALLSEVREGMEVVRSLAGEVELFGIAEGDAAPLDQTYCQRVLDGSIAGVVHDARRDPRVSELPLTQAIGIGSYVGVPLSTRDGRIYMLCCLAREPRPQLAPADVRFLVGLGETVLSELSKVA